MAFILTATMLPFHCQWLTRQYPTLSTTNLILLTNNNFVWQKRPIDNEIAGPTCKCRLYRRHSVQRLVRPTLIRWRWYLALYFNICLTFIQGSLESQRGVASRQEIECWRRTSDSNWSGGYTALNMLLRSQKGRQATHRVSCCFFIGFQSCKNHCSMISLKEYSCSSLRVRKCERGCWQSVREKSQSWQNAGQTQNSSEPSRISCRERASCEIIEHFLDDLYPILCQYTKISETPLQRLIVSHRRAHSHSSFLSCGASLSTPCHVSWAGITKHKKRDESNPLSTFESVRNFHAVNECFEVAIPDRTYNILAVPNGWKSLNASSKKFVLCG